MVKEAKIGTGAIRLVDLIQHETQDYSYLIDDTLFNRLLTAVFCPQHEAEIWAREPSNIHQLVLDCLLKKWSDLDHGFSRVLLALCAKFHKLYTPKELDQLAAFIRQNNSVKAQILQVFHQLVHFSPRFLHCLTAIGQMVQLEATEDAMFTAFQFLVTETRGSPHFEQIYHLIQLDCEFLSIGRDRILKALQETNPTDSSVYVLLLKQLSTSSEEMKINETVDLSSIMYHLLQFNGDYAPVESLFRRVFSDLFHQIHQLDHFEDDCLVKFAGRLKLHELRRANAPDCQCGQLLRSILQKLMSSTVGNVKITFWHLLLPFGPQMATTCLSLDMLQAGCRLPARIQPIAFDLFTRMLEKSDKRDSLLDEFGQYLLVNPMLSVDGLYCLAQFGPDCLLDLQLVSQTAVQLNHRDYFLERWLDHQQQTGARRLPLAKVERLMAHYKQLDQDELNDAIRAKLMALRLLSEPVCIDESLDPQLMDLAWPDARCILWAVRDGSLPRAGREAIEQELVQLFPLHDEGCCGGRLSCDRCGEDLPQIIGDIVIAAEPSEDVDCIGD